MQQLAAVESPDAPALPPARRTWVRSGAALAVGALILGLFIYESDLEAIQEYMGELGWVSPLVLLPYLVVNTFDTLGWRCTLPPAVAVRVPFVSLYLTRMAGEALNVFQRYAFFEQVVIVVTRKNEAIGEWAVQHP